MRALVFAVLLAFAAPAWAGMGWSSLWQTPDQRAENLLAHGHPGEAALLFHDPRHKAYAELQAGNFAQAANDFKAFDDSDGNYNRGNALARAGRLQEAIAAYDAALVRDPGNRDARHNRDLVAKALQQHKPPQQKPSGGGQKSSGKNGQGSTDQDAHKAGNDAGQGSSAGFGAQPNGHPSNQVQPDSRPGQSGGQAGRTGQEQMVSPQAAEASAGTKNPGKAPQADSAGQVRGDAEAALAKPGGEGAANAPLSERQLAREQWLRRIPDDPGGLLRRKFMIEHMLRMQGQQP